MASPQNSFHRRGAGFIQDVKQHSVKTSRPKRLHVVQPNPFSHSSQPQRSYSDQPSRNRHSKPGLPREKGSVDEVSVSAQAASFVTQAETLEAAMPQITQHISVRERLLSLLWMLGAMVIVCVYIGVPFAAVANALARVSLANCLFAVAIIAGLGLIVLDILQQTVREQRGVHDA